MTLDPNHPYPVTIIAARYGGAYEDGRWLAFHCFETEVPAEASGDNGECVAFFSSDAATLVGRGDTPQDALSDLLRRLKRYE
jgi:hypothetical protein